LALSLTPGLWADLTMQHTMTFKFGAGMPAGAAEAMKKQMAAAMPDGITVEMKGDMVHTSMGALSAIIDYGKGTITLLNPKTKQVATIPLAEYGDKLAAAQKIPEMPAEAQKIFDAMKIDVKTEKTGQRATLHGIATEERVVTLTMEMPGMPAPGMRVEIHVWIATAAELRTMPELKELADYAARSRKAMDPAELMAKSMSKIPGLGEKMRTPMKELMKSSGELVIQMRQAMYMPGMGTSEPSMEFVMDMADLSRASIPDTAFEAPMGYQTAPAEELLAALFPSATQEAAK
jgi:hypothetical protein